MNKLVIIGAGRAGRFTNTLAAACGVEVIGFLDDTFPIGSSVDYRKILGGTKDVVTIADKYCCKFAISISSMPKRKELYDEMQEHGLKLLSLIHPSVVVYPGATIGEGVIIQPFCTVQTGARINENVIVEELCAIGVDVEIGRHSVIAPSVSLTGGCVVGRECFIGTRSCINPEVIFAQGGKLGSGSTLIRNSEGGGVYVGSPAAKIK